MATVTTTALDSMRTYADLLNDLGGIDPSRVLIRPIPGTATEADLIELNERKQGIFELIDGFLVVKPMGLLESMLAATLISFLRTFVFQRNLGIVTAPDGTVRLSPGTVRAPDVAFISWNHISGGRISRESLADATPDLAVEVLSPSNTKAELARKRGEYFAAGVRLVWEVDPRARVVTVFDAPERATRLDESRTLDGGDVLPGFALPLADLFAELDRQA